MSIAHTFITCSHEYRVRIEQDESPTAPWKNYDGWLGHVGWFSNRHSDPYWLGLASGQHDPEHQKTVIYEKVSTNGFHSPDLYLYVEVSELRGYWTKFMDSPMPTKRTLVEWAKKDLEGLREVCRQFIEGEVYGFILECRPLYTKESSDWEEVDSCWGFYGWDWKTNGIADHIDEECYQKQDIDAMNVKEQDEINTIAHALEGV